MSCFPVLLLDDHFLEPLIVHSSYTEAFMAIETTHLNSTSQTKNRRITIRVYSLLLNQQPTVPKLSQTQIPFPIQSVLRIDTVILDKLPNFFRSFYQYQRLQRDPHGYKHTTLLLKQYTFLLGRPTCYLKRLYSESLPIRLHGQRRHYVVQLPLLTYTQRISPHHGHLIKHRVKRFQERRKQSRIDFRGQDFSSENRAKCCNSKVLLNQ